MLGLSPEALLELLRFVHILGLAAGIGGAIFADVLGMHLLFSRKRPELGAVVDFVHAVVLTGLVILWLSGLSIAFIKFSSTPVPAKLVAKFVLAAMLTANVFLIRRYLLPLARSRPAPLLNFMSADEALLISLCGSLSFSFWLSALMIAKLGFLQQLPATTLIVLAGSFWLACFIGLVTIMFTGCLVFAIQRSGWKAGLLECFSTRLSSDVERAIAANLAQRGSYHPQSFAMPERSSDSARTRVARIVTSARAAAGQNENETPPAWPAAKVQDETPAFDEAPLASAARSCTKPLAGIAGISFVTNVLMLTGPLFMLQVYDRVLTSKSVPTLTALLGLVGCMFVFMGLLELIRSRILVRIALRIDRILSGHVFQSVIAIAPMGGSTGRSRLIQDLDHIRSFVSGPAPAAFFDLPWTPIYFLVIFLFHWVLGVIALIGAGILVALSLINEFLSRKPVAEAGQQLARGTAYADAGRRNAVALHAMGMAANYHQAWLNTHRRGLAKQAKAGDIAGALGVTTRVIRLFLQSFILGAGAYFAIQQEITPGVIIAVSIIMARALAPIEQVIGQWRNLIGARQGLARIRAALDERPDPGTRIQLPEPKGHVVVENLFAAAPGSTDPILKGLNFALAPGDVLAVVGANATGKSTLARTLVGAWQPLRGNVRLDGAALPQWLPTQLGRNIGYLPQTVELFESSVAANIARFTPDADPGAIVSAARKAHAHEMILQLPDGYATRVGEDGAVLSGGQRQRIGLARAFFGEPTFVVLDEPNANLDPDGEIALFKAIHQAKLDMRTIVVITHKPNLINTANQILVLSDGRQAAFGPLDTILSKPPVLKPVGKPKSHVQPIKPVPSNQPA